MKYQVRGGNAGYIQNGVVYSEGEQACIRKLLLRHHAVQSNIDEKTQKVFNIGFLNEDYHKAIYESQGLSFETDASVTFPLSDDCEFAGHIDFLVEGVPEEHKSCTSLTTYKLVFEQNKYKMDNLVQLAHYMIALEVTEGRLVYTSFREAVDYKEIGQYSWEEIKEKIDGITPEQKRYDVTINSEGQFAVDNVLVDLYVSNILDFWTEAKNVLEQDIIYPSRPETKKKWGSPCDFCPLKPVCLGWENEFWSTDVFIRKAKHEYNL